MSKKKTNKQKAIEPETITQEATKEEFLKEEQVVKETEETTKAMEPTAIGNEKIAILMHSICRKGVDDSVESISIELVAKNISDTFIGSALFEAELYDIEGNTLDKIEHKIVDFKPNVSRTIRLNYSESKSNKVRSYCVRIARIVITPKPKVTGNEKIKILKHSLNEFTEDDRGQAAGVDIAIRNVSDITIATIMFEALFYDIEGNLLDTVKHKEIVLKPNTNRGVSINLNQKNCFKLKSYDIKITKMTTTDIEKVQLRRHEIRTTDAGEEEISGIVKNISSMKTDSALVATFKNPMGENIGTTALLIRDIKPNDIKQFHFFFKPQLGEQVRTYMLNIAEIIE